MRAIVLTEQVTKDAFDEDEILTYAVTHLAEIVGEAASQVSVEYRASCIEIEWARIVGMRNRLVHGYLDVDTDIVWKVVKEDFPALVTILQRILDELPND